MPLARRGRPVGSKMRPHTNTPRSRAGFFILAVFGAFVLLVAASCGDNPRVSDGAGNRGVGANSCLTPQKGCPCSNPGETVACGRTVHAEDNFVYCYMGQRRCGADGRFGDCLDGQLAIKSLSSLSLTSGGLKPLALGTPMSCTAYANGEGGADSGPTTFPPSALPACAAGLPGIGASCDCTGGGATCGNLCNSTGVCNMIGRAGKTADLQCNSSTPCSIQCESGATCNINCNSSDCNIDCPTGSICNIDCNSSTCNLACGTGSCNIVQCNPAGSCPITNTGSPPPPGDSAGLDPCDPYCHVRSDTPSGLSLDSGLFTLGPDGGLMITGGGDAGGLPTAVQTNATGDSTCGGANNVHGGPPCLGSPLTTCQQDFHCDPATDACVWNGGTGWFDGAAGGVDLQIGAGCDYAGIDIIPLCNRGSVAVAPNTTLGLNITNGPEDGCTAVYPTADCTVVTGAGGLPPGQCLNVANCPVSGNKNALVNASNRDVAEAPGRCANNASAVKFTGAPGCAACVSCNTTLTGTIYDPRGVVPLPNVIVYVPSTAPGALPTGPACDSCASLVTGNPMTITTTAADGTFTLNTVPPGVSFPLVILSGRWRRQVMVPPIAACGTAVLPAALSSLPKTQAEGNIPKVALSMASGDQLECLLRKVGIADSEFGVEGSAARVHLYSQPNVSGIGSPMTLAGTTDVQTNLWGNATNLNTYDFVIAPCDNNARNNAALGGGPTTTLPDTPFANAAQRANVKSFVDTGGRLFATHWTSVDFVHYQWPGATGPVEGDFGTTPDNDRNAPSFTYTIDTGNPLGNTLGAWVPVAGAGAAGPPPTITFNSWRHLSKSVNTASGAVRLSYGNSSSPPLNRATGGPHVNMYLFDTPWMAPACGRVVVSQSHVSAGSGGFPLGCGDPTLAMSPQEKGFEFLLFAATACFGLPPTPPPPANPPPLPTNQLFTVDFEAICAPGHRPVWQLFQWRATTPPATSIEFYAATAATQAALPPQSPLPALPTAVPIGIANDAFSVAGASGWTYDSHGATPPPGRNPFDPRPVSFHLANDPLPVPAPSITSKQWLRVYMLFKASVALSPILYEWRQLYDCVPAE